MDPKFNRIKIEDLLNDNAAFPKSEPKIKCRLKDCNMVFKDKEALHTHEEKIHKVNMRHICDICNTTFSSLPNRNKHVSIFTLFEYCNTQL